MPERVHEKRKIVKKKIGVDWWSVIIAVVALLFIKMGVITKIPW